MCRLQGRCDLVGLVHQPFRAAACLVCGASTAAALREQPSQLQVFTLGASVTRGIGTTDRKHSYANRLFEYIAHAFPHK